MGRPPSPIRTEEKKISGRGHAARVGPPHPHLEGGKIFSWKEEGKRGKDMGGEKGKRAEERGKKRERKHGEREGKTRGKRREREGN